MPWIVMKIYGIKDTGFFSMVVQRSALYGDHW